MRITFWWTSVPQYPRTRIILPLISQLMISGTKYLAMFLTATTMMWLVTGCTDPNDASRPKPKVDPESVSIVRFDQLLCSTDGSPEPSSPGYLMERYPVFSDVFFNQIIFPQNTPSIGLEKLVNQYCSAPAIRHLMDTTMTIFPDLTNFERDLGQAFGYFHHYFPDRPIPEVYSYVSEFGIGVFTVESRVLGIGLDFFLGEDYPYYDPAVFPNYMVRTMTQEYLTAKAIEALAQVVLPPTSTGNLLDYMIFNGKRLFISSRLLPDDPMYTLCQYSPQQMKWVEDNELNIWSYFLDLGYFYENDPRKFKKFVDPAPTTPGLPEQAPGRVANWIGYRIVESYMKQNPQISLQELAADRDFQSIMDGSNYKPPRPR